MKSLILAALIVLGIASTATAQCASYRQQLVVQSVVAQPFVLAQPVVVQQAPVFVQQFAVQPFVLAHPFVVQQVVQRQVVQRVVAVNAVRRTDVIRVRGPFGLVQRTTVINR